MRITERKGMKQRKGCELVANRMRTEVRHLFGERKRANSLVTIANVALGIWKVCKVNLVYTGGENNSISSFNPIRHLLEVESPRCRCWRSSELNFFFSRSLCFSSSADDFPLQTESFSVPVYTADHLKRTRGQKQ